jgi:hypothetical protein
MTSAANRWILLNSRRGIKYREVCRGGLGVIENRDGYGSHSLLRGLIVQKSWIKSFPRLFRNIIDQGQE